MLRRIRQVAVTLFLMSLIGFLAYTTWRDNFAPLYENLYEPAMAPPSVAADEAQEVDDDDLVLGFVIDGQAQAYPVSSLLGREHLNDTVAGTPICATW